MIYDSQKAVRPIQQSQPLIVPSSSESATGKDSRVIAKPTASDGTKKKSKKKDEKKSSGGFFSKFKKNLKEPTKVPVEEATPTALDLDDIELDAPR